MTKANLTKVRDAKPRVLASSATLSANATKDPKIAGLPQTSVWSFGENVMRTGSYEVFVHVDGIPPIDTLRRDRGLRSWERLGTGHVIELSSASCCA